MIRIFRWDLLRQSRMQNGRIRIAVHRCRLSGPAGHFEKKHMGVLKKKLVILLGAAVTEPYSRQYGHCSVASVLEAIREGPLATGPSGCSIHEYHSRSICYEMVSRL